MHYDNGSSVHALNTSFSIIQINNNRIQKKSKNNSSTVLRWYITSSAKREMFSRKLQSKKNRDVSTWWESNVSFFVWLLNQRNSIGSSYIYCVIWFSGGLKHSFLKVCSYTGNTFKVSMVLNRNIEITFKTLK